MLKLVHILVDCCRPMCDSIVNSSYRKVSAKYQTQVVFKSDSMPMVDKVCDVQEDGDEEQKQKDMAKRKKDVKGHS